MATIDPVERQLGEDEQRKLDGLHERLEQLNDDAENEDSSLLAEIERLEQEIADLTAESYRPEDIARAGVFIALGHDGEARIERGYLRAEDEPEDVAEGVTSTPPVHGEAGLSAALTAELTAHRTAALQNDLARDPNVGLVATVHALAGRAFYHRGALSCLGLSLNQAALESAAPGIGESAAGKAIAERHASWAARMPEEADALWSFVAGQSTNELLALLAHCVSLSLDVVRRPGSHSCGSVLAHADALVAAMPHDMTRYWTPTVAGYLGRVSKDLIVQAVREGAGDEAARQIAGLKKQAMAERSEQLLDGKGWLPSLLRPAENTQRSDA